MFWYPAFPNRTTLQVASSKAIQLSCQPNPSAGLAGAMTWAWLVQHPFTKFQKYIGNDKLPRKVIRNQYLRILRAKAKYGFWMQKARKSVRQNTSFYHLNTSFVRGTLSVRVLYVLCTCFARVFPIVFPAAKIIEYHQKGILDILRERPSFYQLCSSITCAKDTVRTFLFLQRHESCLINCFT